MVVVMPVMGGKLGARSGQALILQEQDATRPLARAISTVCKRLKGESTIIILTESIAIWSAREMINILPGDTAVVIKMGWMRGRANGSDYLDWRSNRLTISASYHGDCPSQLVIHHTSDICYYTTM